jgi:probable phosphoglycerate mutase
MDLILVRHGEPVRIENATGAADPPLTAQGRAQAAAAGRWLEAEDVHAVYASPLRRAVETAQAIAGVHGLGLTIDDDLAEFDREASFYIPVEELKATGDERWIALAEDRWDELAGLDRTVFRDTVVGAIERVVDAHPSRRVCVVCHGGVINIYLAHILGLGRDLWFEPAYTSISRVAASRSGVRSVVSVNEAGHLRGVEAPTTEAGSEP